MKKVELPIEQQQQLATTRVAILGLGLMGGSLALALNGKCSLLLGCDSDRSTLHLAQDLGIFDQLDVEPADVLPQSDLVILATHVSSIIQYLYALPDLHPGAAVVLDIGSTKTEIVRAMHALPGRFDPIGGHPMSGKTPQSLAHADPDLFLGATFALTPLSRTSKSALALAEQLVYGIGSRPIKLPADIHDRWVAASSHLPYLLANALISVTPHEVAGLIGPGFRSATRLASSSPKMMLDIIKTNRENILQALGLYQNQLEKLANILADGNEAELEQVLLHAYSHYKGLLGDDINGEIT
jgi:prephenate dehydrogenase